MSKKSSFAKVFPPLFILGAVISTLVLAFRYIFRTRTSQKNHQASEPRPMKTVYADPPPMISTHTAQIEQKQP